MIAAHLRTLAASLRGTAELIAMEADKAQLPRCEADLAAILDELVAATDDRAGHFDRFPFDHDVTTQSEEARLDWSRALRRHEAAIAALTAYARARRESLAKEPAAASEAA